MPSSAETWQAVPVISLQLPMFGVSYWTNPWAIAAAVAVLAICSNHSTNHALAQAGSSAVTSLRLSIASFWSSTILERVQMRWRPVAKRSISVPGGTQQGTPEGVEGLASQSIASNRLPSAWVAQSGPQRKNTAVIITVVFFVLVASNAFGLVPLASAVTGQAGTTLGLSFALWVGITLSGIIRLRGRFVNLFLPGGISFVMVPVFVLLEGISYSFRAVSLGVRLWANMLAGHQLLHLVTALTLAPCLCLNLALGAPITVLAAGLLMGLSGLEAVVCVLQAGVFALLSAYYLTEALAAKDALALPQSNFV